MFLAAVGAAVVGYGVMSLVMTATPVSMHTIDHFSLEDTTWVIQSHIMAMYLPSLFSGFLIDKFGPVKIVFSGLVLMAVCLVVGYIERHLMHYWVALVLLGVGWNFLFLGGTTLLTKTYTAAERFKVQAFNDFLYFFVSGHGSARFRLSLDPVRLELGAWFFSAVACCAGHFATGCDDKEKYPS